MEQTRIDWFYKLPHQYQPTGSSGRYEVACPTCGEFFRYDEFTDRLRINSWIDCHYDHAQPQGNGEANHSYSDEYDFRQKIRFTRAGYKKFVSDFNLEIYDGNDAEVTFKDSEGNRINFVFAIDEPESDYEGFFAIINPNKTFVG